MSPPPSPAARLPFRSDALVHLEDLSLEDNRLSRVEGLTRLTALRRLDLGKNRITRLDEMEKLPNLQQLSGVRARAVLLCFLCVTL